MPQAPGDAVDLLNPVPGTYGPRELRGVSPTLIDSWAFFAEDSVPVTNRVRVMGALRYEAMNLDRVNRDATGNVEPSGFERAFRWWSWRAGGVVNLRRDLVAYGQYSNAKDPVNANILLVNANQDFDLTDARQWEVGLKADLDGGRTQVTAAWFDIERDDILERFALDSATTVGGITSRGFELSAAARPTEQARLGANAAWTDATFTASPNFEPVRGSHSAERPEGPHQSLGILRAGSGAEIRQPMLEGLDHSRRQLSPCIGLVLADTAQLSGVKCDFQASTSASPLIARSAGPCIQPDHLTSYSCL